MVSKLKVQFDQNYIMLTQSTSSENIFQGLVASRLEVTQASTLVYG